MIQNVLSSQNVLRGENPNNFQFFNNSSLSEFWSQLHSTETKFGNMAKKAKAVEDGVRLF